MSQQKNPLEMLFHWESTQPDTPWLFQSHNGEWQPMTWGQAADQVRRMATALQALGLQKGDKVAITGRNTAHWFLADLAIAMADMVSVGLYPKQAAAHTTYILEHSECKALFLGPMEDMQNFLGAVPESIRMIALPYAEVPAQELSWDALITEHEPKQDFRAPEEDEVMTLVYTSGTTGNPKGVMTTFGNMMFAARGLMEALPPQGQERFFSYLPLAHAFERGAVEMTSIQFGAQVYFLEDINKLAVQLAEVAPTRFFGVPLVYGRIQAGVLHKLPQKKLDRLLSIPIVRGFIRKKILTAMGLQNARMCFAGAAPTPKSLLEWFDKLGVPLYQGYGMTENSIYATTNRPGANRIGSVGKTMPRAEMKLSEEGEILFKHPGVMKGYYKEPEKTAETFTEDGWLKTGDKGYVDGDGYLYITGRVKDIFKTAKGKYVAPSPIEGAMSRNTFIDQLCLVGMNLKQPVMLLTLQADARDKSPEEVGNSLVETMQAVNAELEAHEAIAKLVIVDDEWSIDNGLMTPTMKVKRSQIEDRYADLIETAAADRGRKVVWEAEAKAA
ncbi:AMP-binding protein [Algiphilus aromaticivorans]|uniref:AMP-binding protein n=1 Tax=Algiphilus aromaticivorans TaxID=382454 RepID=UPI0005C21004|nr:AMP-binding protein [Algiphilus aromaticivorans]